MQSDETSGATHLLFMLALVCLGIGLFMLLTGGSDGESPGEILGQRIPPVMNLHSVFIGQTLCIMGAVFLAAAVRPITRVTVEESGEPDAPRETEKPPEDADAPRRFIDY